jgi:hypothetical protein
MTVDPITALYLLLLTANLALILAGLVRGKRLKRLCRIALWLNGALLVIALIPLVLVLNAMQTSSEARFALGVVLLMPAPILVEFIALAVIYRWRMRDPLSPVT